MQYRIQLTQKGIKLMARIILHGISNFELEHEFLPLVWEEEKFEADPCAKNWSGNTCEEQTFLHIVEWTETTFKCLMIAKILMKLKIAYDDYEFNHLRDLEEAIKSSLLTFYEHNVYFVCHCFIYKQLYTLLRSLRCYHLDYIENLYNLTKINSWSRFTNVDDK